MSFDVFISYSTKDATAAKATCAALEAAKIRCWMAPRDIVGGARWGASIVRAINQCRVMVLIFTRNANASIQVQREVDQAFSRGKTVVPLRIEDVRPADELAYYLNTVHWLDALTPPLERNLGKLVATVRVLVSATEGEVPGTEPAIDDAKAAQAQDDARAEDERRAQPATADDRADEAAEQARQQCEPEVEQDRVATRDAKRRADDEARRRVAEQERRRRESEGEQRPVVAGEANAGADAQRRQPEAAEAQPAAQRDQAPSGERGSDQSRNNNQSRVDYADLMRRQNEPTMIGVVVRRLIAAALAFAGVMAGIEIFQSSQPPQSGAMVVPMGMLAIAGLLWKGWR